MMEESTGAAEEWMEAAEKSGSKMGEAEVSRRREERLIRDFMMDRWDGRKKAKRDDSKI